MNVGIKAPVFYIPHGAGPLPLMKDKGHAELVEFLKKLSKSYPKPEAIVVISAHWEEKTISITGASQPGLIYDYFGFPEQAYNIHYLASGSPDIAIRIKKLLDQRGIDSVIDNQRGFDHGMFVPLALMHPNADIPCVQLSLSSSLDPLLHIEIGKAIASIRNDNIMILGSGFSFHNMRAFGQSQYQDQQNLEFESWLIDTVTSDKTNINQKERQLQYWSNAPSARYCHPREEHLLPLHVCFGAGLAKSQLIFEGDVIGKKTSAFRW